METVLKEEAKQLIELLYRDNRDTIDCIGNILSSHSDDIASIFYKKMLAHPEARAFLENTLVSQRLHVSMTQWIILLFDQHHLEDFDQFISWQIEIGRVHARIKLPLPLFTAGIRILKNEFSRKLTDSSLNREELVNALLVIGELMDHLTDLINYSYVEDTLENERNLQALQFEMINGNLALECERLRLSLSDWLRETLLVLFSKNRNGAIQIRDVSDSDFGLWITHKVELLFPNNPNVPKLHKLLVKTNEIANEAICNINKNNDSDFEKAIINLNTSVNEASFLLSDMIEQMLSMETSRDPLTQMLNRRYLSVIMQRETNISSKQGLKYAVMFVDLDHFKKINDNHGHDIGDRVLSNVAGAIRNMIRPGDYAFRYGGEEFLCLLTNITEQQAYDVSERLRKDIGNLSLVLDEGVINVTTSIGIALYDGQSDYDRIIKQADDAVYQAKSQGRNQCVLAEN